MNSLSRSDLQAISDDWLTWARQEQLPPEGDWRIWLFMGGRGSGKTRAGAEWIAHGLSVRGLLRVGLIGATQFDARAVMVEGPSGLLSCLEEAQYEPSNARIRWGTALIYVLSADEPDSIRGHQFDACWMDEFCKFKSPQEALDMALMALRLGEDPRMLITTTPRNIPALQQLLCDPMTVTTRGRTALNAGQFADGFYDSLRQRYGDTALGRQELDGELIADNEKALWKRSWIEQGRCTSAPPLARIVVAVDPPASMHGDACGIVVAGRAGSEGYVVADCTVEGHSPAAWARCVLDAYEGYAADLIVAEANQGGEMVRSILRQEMETAPVRLVHATRSKQVRATPVAALYERGLIHHVGSFAELEDQLCHFDGSGSSPDRLDALVWALSDLFPPLRHSAPKVRAL